MEVFNITHYPQNVLDRTAKNVKLFKIWQRLALARAGLEVTEMKQTDKSNKEGLFQDAFRRQCKVVFDNFQTLMPCDVTTDKLLCKSINSVLPLQNGWDVWKDISAEMLNNLVPLWNSLGDIPSGKTADDMLLVFRERLWHKKRSAAKPVVVDEEESASSSAATAVSTKKDEEFPNNFFPPEWLVFIHFGPVSPTPLRMWVMPLSNGPKAADKAAEFQESLSRRDQRKRKRDSIKSETGLTSKEEDEDVDPLLVALQKYRGAQFEQIKQTKISNLIRLSEVYQNRGLMQKAAEYLEQADALMTDQQEEMRSPSVSSTSVCLTTPASTTPMRPALF